MVLLVEAVVFSSTARVVDHRIEPNQQTSSFKNQVPYYTPKNDMPTLNWLNVDRDQNLHQHNAAQSSTIVEGEQANSATERTLMLFSDRIIADKVEVNKSIFIIHRSFLITHAAKTTPFLIDRTYRIAALFQKKQMEGTVDNRHCWTKS